MLGLFDGGNRPDDHKKGSPTTYAEPSAPDLTAEELARNVQAKCYMPDLPGPLAIPVPQAEPRRRFPWEYTFLATATGLVLAAGAAYGISHLTNRPNAGYKAPVVQTIQQPANAPTLVPEVGFTFPLTSTPIIPTPTTQKPKYTPKGIIQREDKARGILIDCIQDCDPAYLDQSIINAGERADTLKRIFNGDYYSDRQLVLEAKGKKVRMPLTPDLPYDGAIIFSLDDDALSLGTACDEISDFYVLSVFPAPLWLREGFSLHASLFCRYPSDDFSYVANLPIDSRPYNKVKNNPELMFKQEYLDAHGTGITWVKGLEEDYGWRLPEFRGFIVKMHELSTEGHDTTK